MGGSHDMVRDPIRPCPSGEKFHKMVLGVVKHSCAQPEICPGETATQTVDPTSDP